MKRTVSVRVEVEVDVEDEAELGQLRASLAQRAAAACNTFWGSPRIICAATVLRRNVDA